MDTWDSYRKLRYVDSCTKLVYDYLKTFAESLNHKKILDPKCGVGQHTALFNINNNQVFGLDNKDYRYEGYKTLFDFQTYDRKKIPFPDNFFDVILALEVFEHWQNDTDFLKEVKRVLKPAGIILIETPNKNRLSRKLRKLFGYAPSFPNGMGHQTLIGEHVYFREYGEKELVDLCQTAGLKIKKIDHLYLGLRSPWTHAFSFSYPKIFKNFVQYLFALVEK